MIFSYNIFLYHVKHFLCLFLVIILSLVCFTSHSQEKMKKVLILNSYHRNYVWTDEVVDGITSELSRNIKNIEFYIEYMDTKRVNSDEYIESLLFLYKKKYENNQPDIIIATDDNALNFLLKYADEIFDNIPVVFCGVNKFSRKMLEGKDNFTGIVQNPSILETIELILKLHRKTQEIYVISDNTKTGKSYKKNVQAVIMEFPNIKFTFLDGEHFTHSMMFERLKKLPSKSLVLLTLWLVDKDGNYMSLSETVPLIVKNSNVPVYGIVETPLKFGIMGGKIQVGRYQGISAAEMAVLILKGVKKVTDIDVNEESPNKFIFNYNQLKKWGIGENILPEGSILLNKPEPIYVRYKYLFSIIIFIIVLLFLLCVFLAVFLIQARRSKKIILSNERKLKESEKRFRSIAENALDLIFIKGKDRKYIFVNDAMANLLNLPKEKIIGRTSEEVFGENQGKIIKKVDDETFEGANVNTTERIIIASTEFYFNTVETPLSIKNGNVETILGIVRDITEQKRTEDELKKLNNKLKNLVYTDPLTGLINRLPFVDILERRIAVAESENKKIAVLFLDLEKFKELNDSLGHNFGDKALKIVADRIRKSVRKNDIVGRIGGDEFIVCLSDIKSSDNAQKIAAQINNAFNEKTFVDGISADLTVSIGISIYPDDAENINTLIKNSDLAMYKAKSNSRNSYQLFNEKYSIELEFEQAVFNACKNNELTIYYQPIIDRKGNSVFVEALLRWISPKFGIVMPEKFIPIMEKQKSIIETGTWLFNEVCSFICRFNEKFKELEDLKVSVNISSIQLENNDFVSQCLDIMEKHNVSGKNLIFEITEEQKIKDMGQVINDLSLLKKQSGCMVALDDYGSGYSSFSNITRLPIDIVKLDKTMAGNLYDSNLCNTTLGLISLIKKLNFKVVVEGVETEEQLEKLMNSGCDYFQGYYLSKPTSNIVDVLNLNKDKFSQKL